MTRRTCVWLAVFSLIAAQVVGIAYLAFRQSPTVDEVGHLVAGICIVESQRFDLYPVNPPLVKTLAAIPVVLAGCETDWKRLDTSPGMRTEGPVGRDFIAANGERAFWLFGLARCACLPLVMVGALVCFLWARALYGDLAGLFALVLWVASPNLLAHSSLITADASAAATGLLAAWTFRNWLNSPVPSRAFAAAGSLGLALLTKMTWLILPGLWIAIWLLRMVTVRPSCETRRRIAFLQLVTIVLGAVYFVNLGYGCRGSFRKLGDFEFVSRTLGGSISGDPGNRFRGSALESLPVPLPEDFVKGIDLQQRDFEGTRWSYLGGAHKHGGWWFYYLYAVAVKVPVAALVIGLLACLRKRRVGAARLDEWILLAPCLCLLVVASCRDSLNIGLRYILPAAPFVFVWMSRCIAGWNALTPGAVLRWACLAVFVVESASVYPHSLSFFNALAGGPSNGHFHLIDSNVDWGQDLLGLRDWLNGHPEVDRIHIAYFGGVDPRKTGIRCEVELPERTHDANRQPLPWKPGWYAVSVNLMRGFNPRSWGDHMGFTDTDSPVYADFLRFEPAASIGHSIRIYHLTAEQPADVSVHARRGAAGQSMAQVQ